MIYLLNRNFYNTKFRFKIGAVLITFILLYKYTELSYYLDLYDNFVITTYNNPMTFLTTILSMQITISFFSLTFVSILNNIDKSNNNQMRNYLIFPFKIFDLVMFLIISLPISLIFFHFNKYSLITLVFSLCILMASIYVATSLYIIFKTKNFEKKIIKMFNSELKYILKKGKETNLIKQLLDDIFEIFHITENSVLKSYQIDNYSLLFNNLYFCVEMINEKNSEIFTNITNDLISVSPRLILQSKIYHSMLGFTHQLKSNEKYLNIDFSTLLNKLERFITQDMYPKSNFYKLLNIINFILEYHYYYFLSVDNDSMYAGKYGDAYLYLIRSIQNNLHLNDDDKKELYRTIYMSIVNTYKRTKNIEEKTLYHIPIQTLLCYFTYKNLININGSFFDYIIDNDKQNNDLEFIKKSIVKVLVILYINNKKSDIVVKVPSSLNMYIDSDSFEKTFQELNRYDIGVTQSLQKKLYSSTLRMISYWDNLEFFVQVNKIYKNKQLDRALKMRVTSPPDPIDYNEFENNENTQKYFEPIKCILAPSSHNTQIYNNFNQNRRRTRRRYTNKNKK